MTTITNKLNYLTTMESAFNSVLRAVANHNKLELLGHIHGVADEINVKARAKGLFVKHSFDFLSEGDVKFWIEVHDENFNDICHEIVSFEDIERVIEILNKAQDCVATYGEQNNEEDF